MASGKKVTEITQLAELAGVNDVYVRKDSGFYRIPLTVFFSDVKSAFDAELTPVVLTDWESGSYSASTGERTNSDYYIRNTLQFGINNGVHKVSCDDGYLFLPRAWNGAAYLGTLQTDGSFSKTGTNYAMSSEFDCSKYPSYTFKIAMRMDPSSTSITTADGSHCTFYFATDKTLSKENKAADAKITGNRITVIESALTKTDHIADHYNSGLQSGWYISPSSGKWYHSNGYSCGLYPVPDYAKGITVKASNDYYGTIAFLTTNTHTSGSMPEYATGESGLRHTNPGQTSMMTIPDDCEYIYVYLHSSANDVKPTTVDVEYIAKGIILDKTLTIEGAGADAKATGDKFNEIGTVLFPLSLPYEYATEDAYVNWGDPGSVSTNKAPFCATGYIDIGDYDKITYTQCAVLAESPQHGMAFYDENKDYISGIRSVANHSLGFVIKTVEVPEDAKYARFTWWNESNRATYGNFGVYDSEQYEQALTGRVETLEEQVIDGATISALIADVPQSEGVQNAILTARQFTDMEWTPIADVPGLYRDPITKTLGYRTHKAGCRQTGAPYDSGIDYAYQVGDSIIFDTFITCLKNQNGALYTNNRYEEGRKKAAYYGISCSKFVQTCWGAPALTDSQQIYNMPGIEKIANPGGYTIDDLQLGDGVLNPQVHCTMVTGIFRDYYGKARAVEISESTTVLGGYCRRVVWSESEFNKYFASYGLYRYSLIGNAKYRKARYIDLGDGITAPDDIPITIRRGSYINMSQNSSYKADVDSSKWTTLHDVVNDVDSASAITGNEITLPKNRTGYHELYPTDANGNRGNSSYYFIPEYTASASVDGGNATVTWTSNAPAIAIVFDSTHYSLIDEDTGSETVEIPTGKTSCYIIFRSEYGTYKSESISLS